VQAKYADGGLILGLSQLSLLSKLPLKTTIDLKVVNIDKKIIISVLVLPPSFKYYIDICVAPGCKVIQNITLPIYHCQFPFCKYCK
jgi:hypothetical protein